MSGVLAGLAIALACGLTAVAIILAAFGGMIGLVKWAERGE